jgi:hypothetical protein
MKIYTPFFIAIRVIVYSLLIFGISEGIFFDAGHPYGDSYFGEITFTEIGQEIILFVLFLFYLVLGYKWKSIQPISNIVSLFFLISFIRELNNLVEYWIYPVLVVFMIIGWLVYRDFKKIRQATIEFFSVPASSWFFSGFLATYIFSRLMGRSKFWRLLYDEENYRLAKAATEEGIELFGNTIMLIGAIEFLVYFIAKKAHSSSFGLTTSNFSKT